MSLAHHLSPDLLSLDLGDTLLGHDGFHRDTLEGIHGVLSILKDGTSHRACGIVCLHSRCTTLLEIHNAGVQFLLTDNLRFTQSCLCIQCHTLLAEGSKLGDHLVLVVLDSLVDDSDLLTRDLSIKTLQST